MKEGPVRILYIDDDPILARLAERALGRLGYEVRHAEDVERGRGLVCLRRADRLDGACDRVVSGGT